MALTGSEVAPWRFEGGGAVLLIHATTMYVYPYLLVRAALATFDTSLIEAATALGAGRVRAMRTIVLPLLRPAIGNGALLIALTSLASFSAPYVFGGGFRVLPAAHHHPPQRRCERCDGGDPRAGGARALLPGRSDPARWARCAWCGKGLAPAPAASSKGWRRSLTAVAMAATTAWLLLPHLALLGVSFVAPGPGRALRSPPHGLAATTWRSSPIRNAGVHSAPRYGWPGSPPLRRPCSPCWSRWRRGTPASPVEMA